MVQLKSMPQVHQLFFGTPKSLQNSNAVTSICRESCDRLLVHLDRIEGDQVANAIHHGGLNRVLHYYPLEHYRFLSQFYKSKELVPGSLGENLSAEGFTENDICIGDVFQIGQVKGVVTEPRKPCYTIDLRFGIKGLARKIQDECVTGWFYRILEPGIIQRGDSVALIHRDYPELTLEKCIRALLIQPDSEILKLMVTNPILSENWKKPAQEILESGRLTDDRERLGDL